MNKMSKASKILLFIKCLFGYGNIEDGSICWFSKKFFDIHGYQVEKGGDGIPSYFHKYKCHKCEKEFTI